MRGTVLYDFISMKDMQKTKEIGRFMVTYQKYREIFLRGRLYFGFFKLPSPFLDFLKHFVIHIYCNLFSCT